MSITIIKEGNNLRILESEGEIPAGQPIRLFTEEEFQTLQTERKALLDVQMPSFIRGDEDEDAEDLFEIPHQ